MIVRITRTLLVVQLLIAVAIAAILVKVFHVDSPALAMLAGIGIVLLVRMQIIANNFFLSSRYRSETPEAYRLNWWQACRLFLLEYSASMVSSSITMPFFAFTKRMAERPSALPVLLVHGYGCNSGYWHTMSKALSRAHITHYAVSLEPIVCGINDYVQAVHEAAEKTCKETGSDKIVIVAHSMGGLVTRAYLRDHGCARIAKAITLGTPHHGTGVARFGIGQNCREMHWSVDAGQGVSSAWLRRLAESENQELYKILVSIYTHHDNIISPQTSSHVPGATNIELFGIGHVTLAFHPEVQARVVAEIRAASGSVAGSGMARGGDDKACGA